ncbi:hypothetical protein SteCoe_14793 [Stentor coeruleus]|uniref:Uncharacterized protein n=1 Tax=Stentor coeruleus TaxID=5963 RepID=A0A1R2C598_9CILI|nr:hypothetical protein SteCoe_14793 [Stentor coeruleus]
MYSNKTKYLKYFLLGDIATGKSSFLTAIRENMILDQDQDQPISSLLLFYQFTYESVKVFLNVIEIPGKTKKRTLFYHGSRGCDACIFFYDVTNPDSLKNINHAILLATDICLNAQFFVVGNKIDLIDKRLIAFEEAKKYFDELGLQFWEISCKDNVMIKETIEIIAFNLLNKV